jgi:hypothetical protein
VARYEVSGKQVLTQWFSYRKKNRERPLIGDRRPPSKLGDIQPDHWLAELMSCMFWLCSWRWSQPRQNSWRGSVKDQHLITVDELRAAGALDVPASWRKSLGPEERDLFSDLIEEDDAIPVEAEQARPEPE